MRILAAAKVDVHGKQLPRAVLGERRYPRAVAADVEMIHAGSVARQLEGPADLLEVSALELDLEDFDVGREARSGDEAAARTHFGAVSVHMVVVHRGEGVSPQRPQDERRFVGATHYVLARGREAQRDDVLRRIVTFH